MKLLPPISAHHNDVPELDRAQAQAVDAVLNGTPVVSIFGAPGTGKTTTVIQTVTRLVKSGVPADRIAILSATRKGAGQLRNAVALAVAGPLGGAIVRTPAALAFSILTAAAVSRNESPPRLITGPEQDHLLATLLEGYIAGTLPAPPWPASIPPETLSLRGFRAELRDLMMRAAENGLGPQELQRLGREQKVEEWVVGGHILNDYLTLNTFATQAQDAGRRYDPAGIIEEAAFELQNWKGPNRPEWDTIIADDYHEATAATARLLSVARVHGSRLVLLGDPDVAVQGFRGARPSLLGQAGAGSWDEISTEQERLGQFGAQTYLLDTVWRGNRTANAQAIRATVADITQLVNPLGSVRHRAATTEGHQRAAGDQLTTGAEAAEGSVTTIAQDPEERRDFAADTDGIHTLDSGQVIDSDQLPSTEPESRSDGDADCQWWGDASVPAVMAQVFDTKALESAFIARQLRSAHLREGVPWTDMAVIARSGSQLAHLRRALSAAGVPVAVVGTDIPLRDEPAVRPLLLAARTCLSEPTLDATLELLTSVIGAGDPIAVRKIRRALRREELRGGGTRTSDELLVDAVSNPDFCASLGVVGQPLAKVARVLDAGVKALAVKGATAQTVLWELWDATGLAPLWQRQALASGPGSARADRDLDAVMALFRSAETYLDKMPDAELEAYVEFLESQDIPADSLAQQVAGGGKVSLLTPPGASGQQWPLVVVASVQEGTWPDLRIRDSLMGAARLVEVLQGRLDSAAYSGASARKDVFFDELRAFALSVSRAEQRLLVTAVNGEDEAPSVFVERAVQELSSRESADTSEPTVRATEAEVGETGDSRSHSASNDSLRSWDIPLDMRGLIALVRAELMGALEDENLDVASSRAQLLKYLASQGEQLAAPDSWFGVAQVSSATPLFDSQELVPLSPSKVESANRCALRWSLESSGGQPASALHQNVGVLIHKIASDFPDAGFSVLVEELDRSWPQLQLPSGWPAKRQYEMARHMLENLEKYYHVAHERGMTEVFVERGFSLELEGAKLTGIADRVEVMADGSARITDLKTGKTMPTTAEAQVNPQLGIYQLAALSGAFDPVDSSSGASLVYLASSNKSVATRDQEPIEDIENNWAREIVRDTVATMRSNVFTAHVNSLCPTCPVRRSCPLTQEGQHVVPMNATSTVDTSDADD